jgi:hypothetical protein
MFQYLFEKVALLIGYRPESLKMPKPKAAFKGLRLFGELISENRNTYVPPELLF